MTFTELEAAVRSQHLMSSPAAGHYTTALVTDLCKRAARELGAILQVPRYSTTESLAVGSSFVLSFTANPTEVFSLSCNGRLLRRVPYEEFGSYQAQSGARVWAMSEAQGQILVAGQVASSPFRLEYHKADDASGASPWAGQYVDHHDLIVLRAAELCFRSGMELDKTAEFAKALEFELQGLPLYLRPAPASEQGEP